MRYIPDGIYPLNTIITHPTLGEGKIIEYIPPNKMDVQFGDEIKRLVCGKCGKYADSQAQTLQPTLQQHTETSKSIVRPAALVKQGNLSLYSTSLKVRHIMLQDFYQVDRLDSYNSNEQGYQRSLNTSRAKKFADYIIAGQNEKDVFLPTSVFLATDKNIPFKSENNTIEIIFADVCPFNIVDGQHRIEGLKIAAEKDKRVLDFELPVNIAINLHETAQMIHFLIVNTTQKNVDESIAQRIRARIKPKIKDTPTLPKSLLKAVESGDDDSALKYIYYLNDNPESPWKGKIKMANDDRRGCTIKQKSFVNTIKRYILVPANPLREQYTSEEQHQIFLNYWIAITKIIDNDEYDESPSVLFKSLGVELFCKFYVPFLVRAGNRMPNFTWQSMKLPLSRVFDNADGDAIAVGQTAFWVKGGKAGGLNSSAFDKINAALVRAITNISDSIKKEIQ